MSRVAVVLAAAGVAALVAGCGGSGQPRPPAPHSAHAPQSAHASLVAKGAARVCDSLRPVASRVLALKRPGFSELEHDSSVLADLAQRAYQPAGGNAVMGSQLNQAATAMGAAAISSRAKFLRLAQSEVRQLIRLCPVTRPDHGRD
jgi:hypothetical protein